MLWLANTLLSLRWQVTFEYTNPLIEVQTWKSTINLHRVSHWAYTEFTSLWRRHSTDYKVTLMRGHYINLGVIRFFSYWSKGIPRKKQRCFLKSGRRHKLTNLYISCCIILSLISTPIIIIFLIDCVWFASYFKHSLL